MDFPERCPEGYWPVYKGESFDIWEPDRGESHYYAWVDPEEMIPHLQQKRQRSSRNSRSPFFKFKGNAIDLDDSKTLPCFYPRIAFPDVTRATDQRTVRIALGPPNIVITNQAPFLLWPRRDNLDEAFLFGIR